MFVLPRSTRSDNAERPNLLFSPPSGRRGAHAPPSNNHHLQPDQRSLQDSIPIIGDRGLLQQAVSAMHRRSPALHHPPTFPRRRTADTALFVIVSDIL